MKKYFKINRISFSEFPYIFQEIIYRKLLLNFYEFKEELTFTDKNKEKTIIVLKTEQGDLKFLKEDLIEITKEEYENLKKNCKWLKTLYLSNKINPEDFPYESILFFYAEIIDKKIPLKALKKEIINKKEYIMVKPIKNYTEEEFLVKPEDLIISENEQ